MRRQSLAVLLLTATLNAQAHDSVGMVGGLASGLLHPLTGLDHLVAMVAVGLWGAELGLPALWLLPVVFPLVMAFGGALGILDVPMPGTEFVVAGSGLVLGLAVMMRWRPSLSVAATLVAVFGLYHGHAHGLELPRAANPLGYGLGFVAATGMLHLCGIGVGYLAAQPGRQVLYRGCGAVIALTGAYFLVRAAGGVG